LSLLLFRRQAVGDLDITPIDRQLLDDSVRALAEEFRGIVSPETVARLVEESYMMLRSGATVMTFVPVLTHRFARERLQALAQAEGQIEKVMPEALFVCVHNAGRSQIAAALTHHLSHGTIAVRSAGSQPGVQILPLVEEALREVGVNVAQGFPKPLTDEVVRAADVVVTMGCGDACPIYPGKRYEDWDIPDPSGMDLDGVRRVRDEIHRHVEDLIARLHPERAATDGGVAA
jgi:arsenate reductase (thioredoxin)